ncbi:unnamed protein product, partial [Allacma fusca]
EYEDNYASHKQIFAENVANFQWFGFVHVDMFLCVRGVIPIVSLKFLESIQSQLG